MQTGIVAKRTYSTPSVSMIGTIAGETQTGDLIRKLKQLGPGDQYFLTDPPSCIDSHLYSNCESTSA